MPRALWRVTILATAVATCGCSGSSGVTEDAGGGAEASLPDGAVAQFASCARGGPGISSCGAASELLHQPRGHGRHVLPHVRGRRLGSDRRGSRRRADPATVSNFRLDKYLVTVGRFRQFVSAWNGGRATCLPRARASTRT